MTKGEQVEAKLKATVEDDPADGSIWIRILGEEDRGAFRIDRDLVSRFHTVAAVCRGSWLLGSACGHCSRCEAEAPRAIKQLRESLEAVERRVKLVVGCIPPPSGMGDYADSVKVHLFEAARGQLYDENGRLR